MTGRTDATESRGGGRTIVLVGGLIAGVIVIMAVAAVLIVSSREDTVYPPDSPEAAMAAYVAAWQSDDIYAAYQMLTDRAQERVPYHEFRDASTWEPERPTRVWIEDRRDLDERVILQLDIETTHDGLLGPGRDTYSLRVALIRIDEAWRIDTPLVGLDRS